MTRGARITFHFLISSRSKVEINRLCHYDLEFSIFKNVGVEGHGRANVTLRVLIGKWEERLVKITLE